MSVAGDVVTQGKQWHSMIVIMPDSADRVYQLMIREQASMQAKLLVLLLFCNPYPQARLRQICDRAVNTPLRTSRRPVDIARVTAQNNHVLAIS